METEILDILKRLTAHTQRLAADVNSIGKYISKKDHEAHFNPDARDEVTNFNLGGMIKALSELQAEIDSLRNRGS